MNPFLKLLNSAFGNFSYSYLFNDWIFLLSSLVHQDIRKDALLKQLMISQYSSPSNLQSAQEDRIELFLKNISDQFPFWKNYLEKHNMSPHVPAHSPVIKKLPILDRFFYRTIPNFGSIVRQSGALWIKCRTTGSSGVPLVFFLDEDSA